MSVQQAPPSGCSSTVQGKIISSFHSNLISALSFPLSCDDGHSLSEFGATLQSSPGEAGVTGAYITRSSGGCWYAPLKHLPHSPLGHLSVQSSEHSHQSTKLVAKTTLIPSFFLPLAYKVQGPRGHFSGLYLTWVGQPGAWTCPQPSPPRAGASAALQRSSSEANACFHSRPCSHLSTKPPHPHFF